MNELIFRCISTTCDKPMIEMFLELLNKELNLLSVVMNAIVSKNQKRSELYWDEFESYGYDISAASKTKLTKQYQYIKDLVAVLNETRKYINTQYCKQFVFLAQRESPDVPLISLCVYLPIKDSQFHMCIGKWFSPQMNNPSFRPVNLSVILHTEALKNNHMTRIFAPPLHVMLDIIKKNFHYIELKHDENNQSKYDGLDFSDEELRLIKDNWPRIHTHRIYCFWP